MKPTDLRLREVEFDYEDFLYRTPIKFGGIALDRVTILNVRVEVESRNGQRSRGFGSMPLGNVWSFPSRQHSYTETLQAMKSVTERVAKTYREYPEFGHPIDLTHAVEPLFLQQAATVQESLKLQEAIPVLCSLVCASPFDAALHDAFGKLVGLNCFSCYSREFLSHDLGHYLGSEFDGLWLDSFVQRQAKPQMPLYHLVGALDPLTPQDILQPIPDSLPQTLGDWIARDGLTHLKIKLNGDDAKWDFSRILGVDTIASESDPHGAKHWNYSLDFNERCPNVEYLIGLLNDVKQFHPRAFERIQYIEQPTKRDLKSDRHNLMHEASRLKPVVIDESLIDLETLLLAREMGYTGAALKACKGQSQSLLMSAAIQHFKMFCCVQDLTCPGASLIHSASLAAHIPAVAAIESNARQYCPAANEPWADRFPGIFRISNGTMLTDCLDGPGLGAI
jgi:L-alanine-DL-glutamate epimerase-like enolase superfamily enzyme